LASVVKGDFTPLAVGWSHTIERGEVVVDEAALRSEEIGEGAAFSENRLLKEEVGFGLDGIAQIAIEVVFIKLASLINLIQMQPLAVERDKGMASTRIVKHAFSLHPDACRRVETPVGCGREQLGIRGCRPQDKGEAARHALALALA